MHLVVSMNWLTMADAVLLFIYLVVWLIGWLIAVFSRAWPPKQP